MPNTLIKIFRVGSETDLEKVMNNFMFSNIDSKYYVCETDINVVLNGTKELWFGKVTYAEMDKLFLLEENNEDEDLQPAF